MLWRVRVEQILRGTIVVEAESANAAYDRADAAIKESEVEVFPDDLKVQYTIVYPNIIPAVTPAGDFVVPEEWDVEPGW
jgi:hypothetical protein